MTLSLMTLLDTSKCDAIKLNSCKRTHKLHRLLSSATSRQDREHAGLSLTFMIVMYTKLTCTYLTNAQYHKGP